ncbi:MAG TPA: ribonuclease HI family protein [Patescibacteria group bacterium]|nr:ribonuclease HI family protein [Patescibacteria group bacterium]
MKDKSTLIIYTDGGSRGNPGPAAYGFVVFDENKKMIYEEGKNLGIQTNNYAEYMAIVESLRWVQKSIVSPDIIGVSSQLSVVNYFMDSMLCAMQLSGKWKIKSETIRALFYEVKKLEEEIGLPISYQHVRREFNKEADRMVNLALDEIMNNE